jgi:hypothetical protein
MTSQMHDDGDHPTGDDGTPLCAGRLEIAREPETLEAHCFCPYRGRLLRVGECFACHDCGGLAIDARGKHSYVACDRAERDGLATEARFEPAADGRVASIVRVVHAPPCNPAKDEE